MLQASPKGTVPVLVLTDGTVIEQSLDIVNWALLQSDQDDWAMQTIAINGSMIAYSTAVGPSSASRKLQTIFAYFCIVTPVFESLILEDV